MPSQSTGYEGLLEAVPDALVGVDRAGLIRFANHQTESLFGYSHDDMVGASLETLVPESLREVHAAHRAAYIKSPRTRRMGAGLELIGRRRDGTEFPVNVSLSLMDTEDGMLVIAAVRDMTRHKQTEQQNDRMDQLAAIVEYSDDAILGKTLDGVITSWNPAAETMFGYSENEIIGKSIELLSPENRAGEMTAILSRISAGQHLEHFETIRVRRDGTVFPVSLSVSPICEADGAIIGASTIARDLTGQRQGFDAARSMIEASLDSLVAISPEGKITDANQATVKVTGVSREELIGTSFSDYFTEPDEANKIYQLVFAEGMALNYPLTIRHRSGTATEVLYNASVYRDANGKVLGVFAAARDVTEQVQGQKEVAKQQAKGLERLAELEQFQRLTVGRELKMIELKKEIEYLRRLLPPSASDPDDQFLRGELDSSGRNKTQEAIVKADAGRTCGLSRHPPVSAGRWLGVNGSSCTSAGSRWPRAGLQSHKVEILQAEAPVRPVAHTARRARALRRLRERRCSSDSPPKTPLS